ncbi:MAG: DUF5663 domain-containing protein [Candidatus Parcubacteria bacterium]|nr:DUF5663 domain-containing protein [Candidatus Parcubacteria bacterium]
MNPIQQNITNVLELDKLTPEERQETLIRVGALIYQNVLMRVMEMMTEQNQDEFEKMLDNNAKPEEIFMFLKNKVPDFEKIIDEEANKFKNKANSIMDQIGN